MKKALVVAIAVASLSLTGCVQRVADLTVASTKNMNLNNGKLVKGKRVTGEDGRAVILFPLGVPDVKSAFDKAVDGNKCAVGLSDVVVTSKAFAFLVGRIAYEVTGTEILDRSLPGCENAS
ncbi:hypothetical protein EVG80_15210 [Salmonella enterica subsp. enterica serovar Mississippi]|nr:hypothetical protein [Salmonella enterica subsp. enterica serovar Mississippi]